MPETSTSDRTRTWGRTHASRRAWPRILFGGAVLWGACLVTLLLTGNLALVPTLILLGSFLVPVCFVAWAFETWRDEDVSTELIVVAFVVGGLLGTLGASVLETYLLRSSPLLFLGVGLIEEACKLAALALVTRRMSRRHVRDGVVLGAAVGFGFAAFESAGYAFQVLLTHGGSLRGLVQVEVLRAALSPFGHGLWTAILGGLLFHRMAGDRTASGPGWGTRRRRPYAVSRPGRTLLRGYLGVSGLHALWDSMPRLAVVTTFLLTGTPSQRHLLEAGYLPPVTPVQDRLLTELQIGGLALVSLAGLAGLSAVWRSEPVPTRSRTRPRSLLG